jgi:hypothetical protein
VLLCYLAIVAGYSARKAIEAPVAPELGWPRARPALGNQTLLLGGLALMGLGLIGYAILIVRAGGLGTILFSNVSRSEFFLDIGYLFWVASFMFPGALLFFVGLDRRVPGARFIRYVPALVAFFAFILLQGRSRSFNALVLIGLASHYLIRPLKISQLVRYGSVLMAFALFVGVARSTAFRSIAARDPLYVVQEIVANLGDMVGHMLVNDLSRLRQVVVILDKVPAVEPYDMGRSLLFFLNPWLRLFNLDSLTVEGIGVRLFHLARPDLPHESTGLLPSMVGEMLFNFPWFLAIFPMFVYGWVARVSYDRNILRRPTLASVSMHVVIMTWLMMFVLSSVGQSIFEMTVWLLPIALVGLFAGSGRLEPLPPPAPPVSDAEPAESL